MGPLGLPLISSSVTYHIGDSDVDSDSHGRKMSRLLRVGLLCVPRILDIICEIL